MGRIVDFFLDALFPRACVHCQHLGSLLCATCGDGALGPVPPWTPEHLALTWYAEPSVRRLIDAWKFQGDLSAERAFRARIAPLVPDIQAHWPWLIEAGTVLVPAPLTRRRLAERGFNQAERLARLLGELLNLPVQAVFERAGQNVHLAQIDSAAGREAALKTQKITARPIKGERVLIIDDVLTTGATLSQLTALLEAQGLKEVRALTFAKSRH